MPNTHSTLTALFSDIADAIRAKTGDANTIIADAFPTAIASIPTGITPSGTVSLSSNGTYDVTSYASATVSVPQPSGTVSISSNGSFDVTSYASAEVQVPNTYSAADEGKAVQSGALVSQGSSTFTVNDTYDTTYLSAVTVSVPTSASGTISISANGTYDVTNYASADVQVSGGGTVEPEEKDVNFYDYDGTRVYSYTKSEFLALSAMPANPSHTGLTAQGWNWTLSGAKSYVTSYDILDIGQNYVTSDGSTRYFVTIDDKKELKLSLSLDAGIQPTFTAFSALVNWGDGNTETITGLQGNPVTFSHTYSTAGEYVVSVKETSEALGMFWVINPISTQNNNNQVKRIELGSDVQGLHFGYNNRTERLRELETISVPTNLTVIVHLPDSTSLKAFVAPQSATRGVNNPWFTGCTSLKIVCLPEGFSPSNGTLHQEFFNYCYSLKSITMPTGVTSWSGSLSYIVNVERLCLPLVNVSNIQNFHLLRVAILPSNDWGSNKFYRCRNLQKFKLSTTPSSTGTGGQTFYDCLSLNQPIVIPSNITALNGQAFQNCYCVPSVTVLGDVLSVGSQTFYNLSSCTLFDFTHCTAVPTCDNSAFGGISSDAKIVVPDSLYNDWIVANNWSSVASYIIKASDYANL